VDLFGFHPLVDEARLRLAERQLAMNQLMRAEMTLTALQENRNPALAAGATALLASLYARTSQTDAAVYYYERLRDRWGDVVCREGQTGRQLWQAATQETSLQSAFALPREWLWGRADTNADKQGLGRQSYRRVFPIPLGVKPGSPSRVDSLVFDAGMNAAVARDKQGRMLFPVKLSGGMTFYCQQPGMSRAWRQGNLLFLALADQLAAIDVIRAESGQEDAILWRQSLTQPVPDLSPQPARSQARDQRNPLDPQDQREFYLADAGGAALGRIGPLTSGGAFIQKLRTLYCVDPITGDTLWSRSEIKEGSELFADDQFLCVLATGSNEVLILNSRDGQIVGRNRLPDAEHTWATRGRFVLGWNEAGGTIRVSLHDAVAGHTVWQEDLRRGSRGTLIENRHVALLEPGGRFVIRSLETDRLHVQEQLEAEPQLQVIQVLSSPDQFLLVTSKDVSNRGTINGGLPVVPIQGRLYAFERQTGQPQWQSPATVEGYGLIANQPNDSPALWFVRQYTTRNAGAARTATLRAAVLCIDRRTGRLLFSKEDLQSQANFCEIVSDRASQTASMAIPNYSFRVKFTDQPVPPEPPVQAGRAAPADADGRSPLSRLKNSLMKALLSEKEGVDPFENGGDRRENGDRQPPP
jgi:outer membrane protein assembly factor BamB